MSVSSDYSSPSLQEKEERRPSLPSFPLYSHTNLPPFTHFPVEKGHLEWWDIQMIDSLASALTHSLFQFVRERQQLLLLKRDLLIHQNYPFDNKQAILEWYFREVSHLEVS